MSDCPAKPAGVKTPQTQPASIYRTGYGGWLLVTGVAKKKKHYCGMSAPAKKTRKCSIPPACTGYLENYFNVRGI